jgi:hypothetical protein
MGRCQLVWSLPESGLYSILTQTNRQQCMARDSVYGREATRTTRTIMQCNVTDTDYTDYWLMCGSVTVRTLQLPLVAIKVSLTATHCNSTSVVLRLFCQAVKQCFTMG